MGENRNQPKVQNNLTDRQLAIAAGMIRYFKQINVPLSAFQQTCMINAFRFAERELYGNKAQHPRCERCYSDISIGKIITVSPAANASFEFPLCMKHIQWIEAWIRNQVKKPQEAEHIGEQETL